jgi:hypothetical protein
MSSNFHEHFTVATGKPPSERSTGLVFATVMLIVAGMWRKEAEVFWWALVAAGVLGLVSLVAPRLLMPLNILWFRLGQFLHRLTSPIMMFAIFAGVFVPVGAIIRLWRDPLRSRRQPQTPSYWLDRQRLGYPVGSMRNQF